MVMVGVERFELPTSCSQKRISLTTKSLINKENNVDITAFLRVNQRVVSLYISVTYTTVSPKLSGLLVEQAHDTHWNSARQAVN